MTQPCQDRDLALQAMLDDELDPLAAAALEEHLRGCAGCREAFAKAKQLRLALRRLAAACHCSRPLAHTDRRAGG
jgi:anti-sigma factor RsiW